MPCNTCPYDRLGIPAHCPGAGNPCRSLPLTRLLKLAPDTDAEVTVIPNAMLDAALMTGFIECVQGETPLGRWTAFYSTLPGQTFNPLATAVVKALGAEDCPPLMGDVGFFGPLVDGKPTDVPPELVDMVAHLVEGEGGCNPAVPA